MKPLRRLKAFIEADVGAPIASWRFWCPVTVDCVEIDSGGGEVRYRYTVHLNFFGLFVPGVVSVGYIICVKELF